MLTNSSERAFNPAKALLEIASWHDEARTVVKVPSPMFLDLWVYHTGQNGLVMIDGINAVIGVYNESGELKMLIVPSFATLDRLREDSDLWKNDSVFVDLYYPEDERDAARFAIVTNEDGSFYVTADGIKMNEPGREPDKQES